MLTKEQFIILNQIPESGGYWSNATGWSGIYNVDAIVVAFGGEEKPYTLVPIEIGSNFQWASGETDISPVPCIGKQIGDWMMKEENDYKYFLIAVFEAPDPDAGEEPELYDAQIVSRDDILSYLGHYDEYEKMFYAPLTESSPSRRRRPRARKK